MFSRGQFPRFPAEANFSLAVRKKWWPTGKLGTYTKLERFRTIWTFLGRGLAPEGESIVNTAPQNGSTKRPVTPDVPYFVTHDSFELAEAEEIYGPEPRGDDGEYEATHLPDDVTRDFARRMHYAAWRLSRATDYRKRACWSASTMASATAWCSGNRKLIYRAVQRWTPAAAWADDVTGDCQVVLIQAVAAYNPWLGIRFSTYAFTCLMRALSRLSQRCAADRLSRSLPLEGRPTWRAAAT